MRKFLLLILFTFILSNSYSQVTKIKIDAAHPGAKINPDLYGIFFEDINHAGEGGLYGEMINNRSFEANRLPEDMFRHGNCIHNRQGWRVGSATPDPIVGWNASQTGNAKASFSLSEEKPLNEKNLTALKIEIEKAAEGEVSITNKGYWGINLTKGEKYELSFYAHADKYDGELEFILESGKTIIAKQSVGGFGSEWKKYNFSLSAEQTAPDAQLRIVAKSKGTIFLDMVSLFPKKTFKNRENGLRADLAQKIADVKPGFIRFPGGCVVEGASIANRIQWKNTIGDVAKRPGRWELWGYYNTDGIGFHDFLQFCEDVNAEAMYVIPIGISCQFRKCETVGKNDLQYHIQETMDALEYAMGPMTSKWGAERAKNGHPQPFNIKYLEIGNENYGLTYQEYYNYFYKEIKAKYPQIQTITCTDPGMRDPFAKSDLAGISMPVEMIDEHFYESPDFFYKNAYRYDSYDRNGPKIYVGEYAVKKWDNTLKGNLDAALAEAAFMTGFERNADIVSLSSQAPTLVNNNDRTWNPDMIGFDSYRNYGTPSYYVTKLFSQNLADQVLPVKTNITPEYATENEGYGMAGFNNLDGIAYYKDVNVTINGKTFANKDLVTDDVWSKSNNGVWKVTQQGFQALPFKKEVLDAAGTGKWTDYSLNLKAKAELVEDLENICVFFYKTGANKHYCWNLSRWNRFSWLQWYDNGYESYFGQAPGKVELNRWYDITIKVKGDSIFCYLDNELKHKVAAPKKIVPNIYTCAGKKENGDVVIKVVNPGESARSVELELDGAEALQNEGTAMVLTSTNRMDENNLEQPERVSPKTSKFKGVSKNFTYTFEAHSVTVLTLKKAIAKK